MAELNDVEKRIVEETTKKVAEFIDTLFLGAENTTKDINLHESKGLILENAKYNFLLYYEEIKEYINADNEGLLIKHMTVDKPGEFLAYNWAFEIARNVSNYTLKSFQKLNYKKAEILLVKSETGADNLFGGFLLKFMKKKDLALFFFNNGLLKDKPSKKELAKAKEITKINKSQILAPSPFIDLLFKSSVIRPLKSEPDILEGTKKELSLKYRDKTEHFYYLQIQTESLQNIKGIEGNLNDFDLIVLQTVFSFCFEAKPKLLLQKRSINVSVRQIANEIYKRKIHDYSILEDVLKSLRRITALKVGVDYEDLIRDNKEAKAFLSSLNLEPEFLQVLITATETPATDKDKLNSVFEIELYPRTLLYLELTKQLWFVNPDYFTLPDIRNDKKQIRITNMLLREIFAMAITPSYRSRVITYEWCIENGYMSNKSPQKQRDIESIETRLKYYQGKGYLKYEPNLNNKKKPNGWHFQYISRKFNKLEDKGYKATLKEMLEQAEN